MKQIVLKILGSLGLLMLWRHAWMLMRRLAPPKPLVPEQAFYTSVLSAIDQLHERVPAMQFGDYLEFGVSRGTSLASVYRALLNKGLSHVRLIGFDSFQGLPPEAADEGWVPGDYKSSLEATRAYLASMDVDMRRVTLVEGWFSQTCTEETKDRLSLEKASLIMVDCDIYTASRDVLRYAEPLIRDHAIVICDDWGSRTSDDQRGQSDAFEEFLQEHPQLSAQSLPSYRPLSQIFLVSRRTD
ncbi:MAG: class I SAM-dependent methyltransferase [Candidatus Brocadiia bacterium]|nr:MAG: class I SAM-dependent methyltransferase [Candidatus Brocadiia bacterium]